MFVPLINSGFKKQINRNDRRIKNAYEYSLMYFITAQIRGLEKKVELCAFKQSKTRMVLERARQNKEKPENNLL